jgi:hypothetical protein
MADAFLQSWDVPDFKTLASIPDAEPKSIASRPASSSTAAASSQAAFMPPRAAPGAASRSSSEPPTQELYKKELAMKELENMQLRTQVEQYKKAAEEMAAAEERAATTAPPKELTERLDRLEQLIKDAAQAKEPVVTRASAHGSSLSDVAPPSAASSSSGSGFRMTLNEKNKQSKQQQQQKRPRGGKHRVLRSDCMRCKLCLRTFMMFKTLHLHDLRIGGILIIGI